MNEALPKLALLSSAPPVDDFFTFWRKMNPKEFGHIVKQGQLVNCGANSIVYMQGQESDSFFVVNDGTVEIVLASAEGENPTTITYLGKGDIFGEMALLENKPRSASAAAYEDAYLLAVNKANFERMVQTQPQIVTRLTTLLSERLWFIYKQLANTLITDPVGRVYDALLMTLEKNRVPLRAGATHHFEFGTKELIGMVGLSQADGGLAVQKLLENNKIKLIDNKFTVLDLAEIEKQCEYFRKMQKIERARKESQSAR